MLKNKIINPILATTMNKMIMTATHKWYIYEVKNKNIFLFQENKKSKKTVIVVKNITNISSKIFAPVLNCILELADKIISLHSSELP